MTNSIKNPKVWYELSVVGFDVTHDVCGAFQDTIGEYATKEEAIAKARTLQTLEDVLSALVEAGILCPSDLKHVRADRRLATVAVIIDTVEDYEFTDEEIVHEFSVRD